MINKIGRISSYLFLSVLLFFLYSYRLEKVGTCDFDSTKFYSIAIELNNHDYSRIFSHAAPLVHLINAGIYAIFPDYLALEYFSCFCVILATLIFCFFVTNILNFSIIDEILLILLIGTTIFLVNIGSYISPEPLGLLLFIILFTQIYKFPLHTPFRGIAFLGTLLGILLVVNYKAILLIPILLIIALYWHRQIFKPKPFTLLLLCVISPYILISLVGYYFLNHPFLDAYRTLFAVAYIKDVNPTKIVALWNTDYLFYFKYLLNYENPVLIGVVIISPILFRREVFSRSHNPVLMQLILLFVFYYLIIMMPIQKAPRGILFILPLISFLLFYSIYKFVDIKSIKYALVTVLVIFQLYLVYNTVLQYRYSNYAAMGKLIEQKNISKITTSASINIIPFLTNTQVELKFSEKELPNTQYLLLDYYYLVAGLHSFDSIAKYKPKIYFREKTLEAPLQYLENCEYSGISIEEALNNRMKVLTDTFHLSLIKIGEF